ncbi:MAG TPA: phosphopantetheine-binding protein [Thermoanaerobaculia bacterium]
MTESEVEEKLIAIVQQEKGTAGVAMLRETALADAGIDSLDQLTILFAIEEQFGISIPDNETRAIRTFGDLVEIVKKRTT